MLTLYYAIGTIVLISVCFALKNGWCLCGDEDNEELTYLYLYYYLKF